MQAAEKKDQQAAERRAKLKKILLDFWKPCPLHRDVRKEALNRFKGLASFWLSRHHNNILIKILPDFLNNLVVHIQSGESRFSFKEWLALIWTLRAHPKLFKLMTNQFSAAEDVICSLQEAKLLNYKNLKSTLKLELPECVNTLASLDLLSIHYLKIIAKPDISRGVDLVDSILLDQHYGNEDRSKIITFMLRKIPCLFELMLHEADSDKEKLEFLEFFTETIKNILDDQAKQSMASEFLKYYQSIFNPSCNTDPRLYPDLTHLFKESLIKIDAYLHSVRAAPQPAAAVTHSGVEADDDFLSLELIAEDFFAGAPPSRPQTAGLPWHSAGAVAGAGAGSATSTAALFCGKGF